MSTTFLDFKGDTVVASVSGMGANITIDSYSTSATDIGAVSGAGSASDISKGDHTHKGVFTVKILGGVDIHASITLSEGSGISLTQVGNDIAIAAPGSSTDEKVGVSANDTTPDFLLNKLAAGNLITLTELNDGADEDVQIAVDEAAID